MEIKMTDHARKQLNARGITIPMVEAALIFGSRYRRDGSLYYFLGKRELHKMQQIVVLDNPEKWEGLTLVCDPKNNVLITLYKNKEWPQKKLRKKTGRFFKKYRNSSLSILNA
jgi:hypothetical protein